MDRGVVTSADGFSAALSGILEHAMRNVSSEMESAIKESCKVGRRAARANSRSATGTGDGTPPWRQGRALEPGQRYPKGFSYKVVRESQTSVEGHIGNSDKPGLVHLLEKGHALSGGGRVQGYPHLAKAADKTFEDFEGRVHGAVQRGLEA